MADLDSLKTKYDGVLTTIQGFSDLGASVEAVDRVGRHQGS